jgi:hypothetical protein
MTLRSDRRPLVAFFAFASSAYLVGGLVVVPALGSAPRPDVLAAALAVDLAVIVPLAWAGAVRARGGRWITLAPVVALSALWAWLVVPEAHHGVLAPLAVLLPLVEVGGVALVVVVALVRAWRRGADGEPHERIRSATDRLVGPGAASRAIAYEVAVFRYALGPAVRVGGPGAFTYRQSSGYAAVLAGVGVAAVLELVGGHLLVQRLWGDGATLVHLAVSGYAILWLLGDWRALAGRPIRLDGDTLRVRCGLRWSVDVPVAEIETVYHVRKTLPADRRTLDASVLKNAQFLLTLRRPVVAEGPYGLRKEVTRVAVAVDEPERFLSALATAMDV